MLLSAVATNGSPVVENGDNARSTVSVVLPDDAPSGMNGIPDVNQFSVDATATGGLVTKQVGAAVTPSRQSKPVPMNNVNDAVQSRINDGIQTLGRAAALERQGVRGHGTMQIDRSLEPTIIPDAQFSSSYFSAGNSEVDTSQALTGTPILDGSAAAAGASAAVTARAATTGGSVFDALLQGE